MLTKLFKKVALAVLLGLVILFLLYAAVKKPESLKAAVIGFVGSIGGAGVALWHWVGQYF